MRIRRRTRRRRRAKISKKKKKVKQRTVDPATGKKKTQLRFEEVDKPAPASKLTHAVTAAPGKTISSQVHKKIGETEEDNVGVQSVHQVEEAAESGVHMAQSAYRSHKLRPLSGCGGPSGSWKKPMSMRCIRSLWRRIRPFPATPFPAGSKSRLSRNSMPPPSVPVRVLMQRQRLRRIPPKPRKKPPRKPKRPGASSGGIAGASVLSLRCFLWCVPLQTAFPPVRCCFRAGCPALPVPPTPAGMRICWARRTLMHRWRRICNTN